MYQTNEEQKNEKFDYPKMNNNNLCERCKNAEIVLICEECSPFHNFCQKCDGIIHQLPSRLNHIRQNIYDNISNNLLFKCNYNNKSSPNLLIKQKVAEEKINNLINDVNNEIAKENELENIKEANINNTDNQNIQNDEDDYYNEYTNNENFIYNNNEIPQILPEKIKDMDFIELPSNLKEEGYKKTFTKEYILELQNIHQKEKNELLFKISSLENTLERIKITFNEQIKNLQKEQSKSDKMLVSKINQIKNGYNLKYKNLENEKDLQINLVKEQLSKEVEEKKELYKSLEKIRKDYNILQNNSANNMDEINHELILIKNEYDDFRQETDKIIDKLKHEYENKILNIQEENEKHQIDINIKHKMELDNINDNIKTKYQKVIQDLKSENSKLKKDNIVLVEKINEIENYLEKVHIEYNNAANVYNNATNDLNSTINQKTKENEELVKKLEELNESYEKNKTENEKIYEQLHQKNEENNKIMEEMKILNNTLINLKKNNEILNEQYNNLQKEYNDLSVNSMNLSMEYNNKIKSLNFIEDRNAMLERENNHLRNQLDKCINPFDQ